MVQVSHIEGGKDPYLPRSSTLCAFKPIFSIGVFISPNRGRTKLDRSPNKRRVIYTEGITKYDIDWTRTKLKERWSNKDGIKLDWIVMLPKWRTWITVNNMNSLYFIQYESFQYISTIKKYQHLLTRRRLLLLRMCAFLWLEGFSLHLIAPSSCL